MLKKQLSIQVQSMKLKAFMVAICMVITVALSSCQSGWDAESKKMFYDTCSEDLQQKGVPQDKAQTVCQCRLDAVMEKYPSLADVMGHIEEVIADTSLQRCE